MNKVKLDLDHVVCCVSSARYKIKVLSPWFPLTKCCNTRSYYRKESAASGIKGTSKGSKVPQRDQRQHA